MASVWRVRCDRVDAALLVDRTRHAGKHQHGVWAQVALEERGVRGGEGIEKAAHATEQSTRLWLGGARRQLGGPTG